VVCKPIAGNVFEADALVAEVLEGDDADRCLQAIPSGADASQVGERDDHADGAVAAHIEVADVVEEDHARTTGVVARLAKESADHDVRSAGLVNDRGAIAVPL